MKLPVTKEVIFAYSSSITAKRLGFDKTGCWAVLLSIGELTSYEFEKGFSPTFGGKHEALNYADTLPYDYNAYSVKR